MCARKVKNGYEITSDATELPRGSRFTVTPGQVNNGGLALFQVNGHHVVGRLIALDDSAMIVRPSQWISISSADRVVIVGAVVA